MSQRVQRGLDVLRAQLTETAPEYFNTETPEGRAALLIASVIATSEFTRELPFVISNPHRLYTVMGGPDNEMLGWAQLNTRYFNDYYPSYDPNYLTSEPSVYNKKVGRVLYGIDSLTPGKEEKFIHLMDFANKLENGEFRTEEEVLEYLQRTLPWGIWPSIHLDGVDRILGGNYIGYSYNRIYHNEPTSPTPTPQTQTVRTEYHLELE